MDYEEGTYGLTGEQCPLRSSNTAIYQSRDLWQAITFFQSLNFPLGITFQLQKSEVIASPPPPPPLLEVSSWLFVLFLIYLGKFPFEGREAGRWSGSY